MADCTYTFKTQEGEVTIRGMAEMKAFLVLNGVDAIEGAGDVVASEKRDVLARIPELEQAAQGVKEGTVSREQYDALVNDLKPVTPYQSVPAPATEDDMRRALTSDKVDRIGVPSETLERAYPVGLRLDIPAYANHGVWVVSVHEQEAGYNAGKSIGYESVAAVTNPTFGVVEKAALNIAGGKPKATIAVMKGDWKPVNDKQATTVAKAALKSKAWVQVGMDPTRHAYFYDRANMQPVVSADEAVQIGPLVLAKNPVYGEKSDFLFSEKRLIEDIPNEDWLQGKTDYAQQKGRNQSGVPFMGAITGYYKGPVDVSVRVLSQLKGQRDEQNNRRQDSLDYIRKNWDEVSKQPPYIEVAYNGEAWVSEGNHRIMVAAEKGVDSLPVEIRYFDGGQRRNGPLAPGRIPSLDSSVAASEKRNIFGQKVKPTWAAPADTKLDARLIYKLQDKQIDLKRISEAIKSAAGGLTDQVNAYLKEELYHGRAAKQTKDFLEGELSPLVKAMQANRVTMGEFEEYLHNRHAEERNIQVAKVNPKFSDGGSGIDTADARAYLAGLDPAKRQVYESLAKRVDAMSKSTRDLMVASGLETKETIDAWEAAYGKYVPLFREDAEYGSTGAMGSGQGFSVRGPASRRATGSDRPVVDIMANLAMQRERTIVRAEKARVGRALYGLAVQNPNSDFWMAVDPNAIKDVTGTMAQLVSMGLNPLDVQSIMQEPKQTYIDPRTGLATQRVNPALRSNENVLAVRIDGQDKFVFFNNRDERAQRMVGALKNLDAQELGMVMNMSAKVSRYFASVNTQFNPVFGAINLIRDTQGAAFNLTTTAIADRKAQVMAGILPAIRGIYSDLRSRRAGKGPAQGVWAKEWEEFQDVGGQTGFRDMFTTSEDRTKGIQKEFDRMTRKGYDPRRLVDPKNAVFGWLSDYNETLENAVRLSAYRAAKDKGLSKEQAASIAKNLTVNFNRKGEAGIQAGALYAFFNASVQGTARLLETLKGPAGKKIVAGGMLLGVAQALALAAAGFGDDEPPDFVKERNLVIPTGDGKYVTIPMPLGLNVIPNTSRVLTEWVMSGFKETPKRVAQITGAFLDMFNPIGNAGWSGQTFTPTFADPAIALFENRDWTGKPIAKEDRTGTDPTPGYTRAKDTASAISKGLSYLLNAATGGTDYKQGLISPTPDQIDYLIGQVTGGVGREALKVSQAVQSTFTGEELPSNKVPILGRFYGDTKEQSGVSSKFYANITKLNEHENEIKGRQKDRVPVGDYFKENPEARLFAAGNAAERQVSELRRQKRDMIDRGASKESIKLIEERITRRMKILNSQIERAEQ